MHISHEYISKLANQALFVLFESNGRLADSK